jgi:MYXO-CTERM domain-containing protein
MQETVMRRSLATTSMMLVSILLASLAGSTARAQTFPASFAPLPCQRGVMTDGYRDQSGAIDDRDVVGAADRPAGFRAVDAQFLYLRLRVDASPMQGNGLTQFAWGFVFDTNADPTNYEILIAVDGAAAAVNLYSNTVTTVPDSPADPADQLVMSYPFAQNGRVADAGASIFDAGNDSFIDMAVPWNDLDALGLGPATVTAIWAASSTNPDRLNGDFACHDAAGTGNVPALSQTRPAPVAPDPARTPNIVGESGIEGGPGCNCGVQHAGDGGDAPAVLAILIAGVAAASRRRRDAISSSG